MKQHPYFPVLVGVKGSVKRKDGKPIGRKISGKYELVYIPCWGWRRVHHLVLQTYDRFAREGEVTRHLDGNSLNNCFKNLQWGTQSENAKDRTKHGTQNPPPHMTEERKRKIGEANKVHCKQRVRDSKGRFIK